MSLVKQVSGIGTFTILTQSVAVRDVHPGSQTSDLIQRIYVFQPKKLFLRAWKYNPGCSSRIRILIFYPSRIPDKGGQKGTVSESATLPTHRT